MHVSAYLGSRSTPDPVETSNDGSVGSGATPAAGNQFTVLRVTDTTFDVYNDTCSDVKLRVVASRPDITVAQKLRRQYATPAPTDASDRQLAAFLASWRAKCRW